MVSTLSLAGMVFSLLLSFLFPLILAIIFIRKYKTGILPFVTGAGIFIFFALILEQLIHLLVLGNMSPIAETIKASPFLLGMYGGFTAGIFEETGRLIAFLFILRKTRDWSHGVVYGIGHGGIEAWILLSWTYVNNLVISLMVNGGQLDTIKSALTPVQIKAIDQGVQTLISTDSSLFFIAGIERVLTVIIHIGLSLLVLLAVRNRKYYYFVLAILLHAALNFTAVYMNMKLNNIVLTEIIVAAFAAASVLWIIRSKALMTPPVPAPETTITEEPET